MKRVAITLLCVAACSSPSGNMDGGTGGGSAGGGSGGGSADSGSGGGGGGGGGSSGGGKEIPLNHRPTGEMCSHSRPSGIPTVGAPGCMSDAECDGGVNGRCSVNNGGAQFNVCTYDECFSDTDCTGGVPCECRKTSEANRCLTQSDCRLDSDCGDGGFCALSPASQLSCTPAYHCTTPNDQCVNSFDCSDAGTKLCAYDPGNLNWTCTFFCAIP
jgi:hypothetical protein